VEPTPLQLPVEPTPLQQPATAVPPARPAPAHPPVEPTPLRPQHAAPSVADTGSETVPGPRPAPQHVAVAPATGSARVDGPWLRFNGLALNAESRDVTVDGAQVELSPAEFDLLASLLATGRRVRSKADLVLAMRGQEYVTSYFVNEDDKRSVDEHVASLSRQLGDDDVTPRYVESVSGVGYRLAEAR
jgi:DNA-binding response OmpR family regulator